MTYARARLLIGITAVGLNVLIAVALLLIGAQSLESTIGSADWGIWIFPVAYVLWMIPFDFLGGWWLPKRYDRSKQLFGAFMRDWTSGTFLQSLVFLEEWVVVQ